MAWVAYMSGILCGWVPARNTALGTWQGRREPRPGARGAPNRKGRHPSAFPARVAFYAGCDIIIVHASCESRAVTATLSPAQGRSREGTCIVPACATSLSRAAPCTLMPGRCDITLTHLCVPCRAHSLPSTSCRAQPGAPSSTLCRLHDAVRALRPLTSAAARRQLHCRSHAGHATPDAGSRARKPNRRR